MATGIRKRHSKLCRSRDGGGCNCDPTYEAGIWLKREGKKLSKTFKRESEAKAWRTEALSAASKGALRAPKPTTVRQAWDAWETGAKSGAIRNRSGNPYKPSALRSYERAMRLRGLDEFGSARLADIQRSDLQRFVYRLGSDGLDPSTVQVTLLPLRAIFRHAVELGELMTNPCDGLKMPALGRGRDRIATPQEAESLIAALALEDRAIWATAMYAGLRRGELQALPASGIDLAAGVIRVDWGWDFKEGLIELKSNAGRRRVPIADELRIFLAEDLMRSGRRGSEFAFSERPDKPFRPESLQRRADAVWREAGLSRITPHECRHTFASLMIAAGVNAKALSTFMGHANISITLDRYGHLMPGSEGEAAHLLDAYLGEQRKRAKQAAGAELTVARTVARPLSEAR